MTSPTRVLFIAVDAGDKDLIEKWAGEGLLPTFRSLRARAAWGPTANPTGLFVGAIWPSFWTGLSPARHGRYCFSQLRTGTYDHYQVTPFDTRGEPFWDALSQAGRRVAVLDVPKTRLSRNLNGIQIVDWGTHDPELGVQTWPESLAGDVESVVGRHPVGQCDEYLQREAAGLLGLRDALVRGVEMKSRLAEHFLGQGGWDLFLTVFAESHCAGHQFWSLHDPAHPRHDSAAARSLGDPLRDVYVAIDAAIGRLLARATPDTAVFVLASHGMGPHYDGTFLLEEMLRRLFAPPEVPRSRKTLARAAESAWRTLPLPVQKLLRPLRGRVKRTLADAVSHPELSTLPCFVTPNNDVYGGIRVNLAGREPEGRVRPGAEYDAFCESLTRDLLAFVNLDSGRPLVRRVLRTADLYGGERLEDLPDLMIEWDREAPIATVHSPKTGVIRGVFGGIRTGDHKPEGMIFALGPGIAPDPLPKSVSVEQFAPTIASRLGVPLPQVDAVAVPELARTDGRSGGSAGA
ncbi:MAG: alkaline phosphatase family protein [Thermoanaerobaculia bacterium]